MIDFDRFKKHFKGRKKSSEATLDSYVYFLKQVPDDKIPKKISEFSVDDFNDFLKSKDMYSWQLHMRSAMCRWLNYLCSLKGEKTIWKEIEKRIRNKMYLSESTEYKFEAKSVTETDKQKILDNVQDAVENDALKNKKYIFPLYLSLKVLFDTGLRRKELMSLELKHFDIQEKEIKITSDIAKGKEERYVFYQKDTSELLIEYLKQEKFIDDDMKSLGKTEKKIFVIKNLQRKVLDYQLEKFTRLVSLCIYPCLDRRVKKPPVVADTKFFPHRARHTLAHEYSQHADVRSVQSVLGHKNIQTTEIYLGNKNFEKARKDYRKFEEKTKKDS